VIQNSGKRLKEKGKKRGGNNAKGHFRSGETCRWGLIRGGVLSTIRKKRELRQGGYILPQGGGIKKRRKKRKKERGTKRIGTKKRSPTSSRRDKRKDSTRGEELPPQDNEKTDTPGQVPFGAKNKPTAVCQGGGTVHR